MKKKMDKLYDEVKRSDLKFDMFKGIYIYPKVSIKATNILLKKNNGKLQHILELYSYVEFKKGVESFLVLLRTQYEGVGGFRIYEIEQLTQQFADQAIKIEKFYIPVPIEKNKINQPQVAIRTYKITK